MWLFMPGERVQNQTFWLRCFSIPGPCKVPGPSQVATFLPKGPAALICYLQLPGAHHKVNTWITPTNKTLIGWFESHEELIQKKRAYLPQVTEHTAESRKAEASTLAICWQGNALVTWLPKITRKSKRHCRRSINSFCLLHPMPKKSSTGKKIKKQCLPRSCKTNDGSEATSI